MAGHIFEAESQSVRRFTFTAPREFLVKDTIKTERPQLITSFLHSDKSIVEKAGGFEFESGTPNLFVEILQPELYDTAVGPNFLTAPGRPGSVDKGEREQRGVRLAISTRMAQQNSSFRIKLKINTSPL